MSRPPWSAKRVERWELASRRAMVCAGLMLVAGPLLPYLVFESGGGVEVDWWFARASSVGDSPSGYPDRSPRALLYLALGLWTLRCARVTPLSRRAALAGLPALGLVLMMAARETWHDGGSFAAAYPGVVLAGWVSAALPALALLLVRERASVALGRRLCAFAGAVWLLYELYPATWDPAQGFAWIADSLERGTGGRLWVAAWALALATALALLAAGLPRRPPRAGRWLAWRLWLGWLVALHVSTILLLLAEGPRTAEDLLWTALSYPLVVAREWGHYLLVVVCGFLALATRRRPEPR